MNQFNMIKEQIMALKYSNKNPNKDEPHLMQIYYIWYLKIQIGKVICYIF